MERLRGTLAVLLCIGLSSPSAPALAETAASPRDQAAQPAPARPAYQSNRSQANRLQAGPLQGDQRILQALNRFTFGPRPGDLEAVRAMDLEQWFDRQLQPGTLDQTDLDARLAQFPAMQANPQDLLFRLPSNAVIRQVADGKVSIPKDPALHALYENELARVELNRKKKAQEKQQAFAVPALSGAALAPEAAEKGRDSGEFNENRPAGAKAHVDSQALAAVRAKALTYQSCPDAMPDSSAACVTPAMTPATTSAMAPATTSAMAPPMTPAMSGPGMDEGAAAKMAPEASQPRPSESQSGEMSMMTPAAKPEQPAFDPAQIAPILNLPPQQRVSRLVAMEQPEFDGFRKALKPPQRAALIADLSPAQREYVSALESPQRVVVDELAAQRLTRDIYSSAQLQEVMTDFWLNHFNVYLHKNEETPYYLVSYERDVIRPLALGKFEDLLEATAHSPAMLLYLDNASSMGPDSPAAERSKAAAARNPAAKKKAPDGLNENYARELMELHTLGVNGGYTQADVTQVARVFTGWTVDRPQRGGGFKFDENRHEPGTKKVLGKKIKDGGEREGRELLHILAMRPATAKFLSRKLAVRFVSDDPPKSLVDRMAKSYLKSGGDISAVLKTLFHSPEFWDAGAYRAKVKTPLEYVVSAARASNATTDNLQPLANALREMGMPLYGAVPPTGYKWESSTWVSTGALVNRMNFALSLAANKLPGIGVDWTPQLDAGAVPSPEAEEQRLESLLVAGGVGDSTRAAVLEQFEAQSARSAGEAKPVLAAAKPMKPGQAAAALARQDQLLAGLLLGSPEFQRR